MTKALSIRKNRFFLSGSLCLALLYQTPVLATGLYKWIDEEGQVRYSDHIPMTEANKRHQKLSPEGYILETKEAAIPPEQLARERAARELAAEQARIQAEILARQKALADQHDNVLLMTFSNEDEILEAQKERIEVIDSVIKLLQKNIKNEEVKLERLEKRAFDQYTSREREVPGGLAQNIEYFSEKIIGIQQQLGLKMDEREKVKQQYIADLIRYRELIQAKQAELDKPNP